MFGRSRSASRALAVTDASADSAPDLLGAAPGKTLSPEARRALKEAAARRATQAPARDKPVEIDGPSGPEPTRHGDWERKGIAYDF
jgi:hypothetical protein